MTSKNIFGKNEMLYIVIRMMNDHDVYNYIAEKRMKRN